MFTWTFCFWSFPQARHRQRGLALIVALIALAAMSLVAIGLVRQVNLNVATASNLAFRKSASLSAVIWTEEARRWLLAQYAENPANTENPDAKLEVSQPGQGYYALRQAGSDKPCGAEGFDGVDFTGTCAPQTMTGKVAWQNAD
ncbi:MAG: pilus assembly PilX N-terminal domain-containing protein, partial [Zoogloeaceae bacterium]|nr:pilus assembly PilX N-terminal domain-containing protein [Zoogloeaceae bacterium]